MIKRYRREFFACFLLICIAVGVFLVRGLGDSSTDTQAPPQTTYPQTPEYAAYPVTAGDVHRGTLLLVNGENPYRFDEDVDLISVFEHKNSFYQVKDTLLSVRREIMEPLNDMLGDFYNERKNKTLIIISGHRTYDLQQSLFNDKLDSDGAVEAAKWVAQPGMSEHHTGLALDFSIYFADTGLSESYDGTGDFEWINSNAYKYGFVLRYAEDKKAVTGIYYEPWHFRYVGLPHSHIMAQKRLCLEEYIDYLRENTSAEEPLETKLSGSEYAVYYAAYESEGNVPVPSGAAVSVSGNNVDGFIVTAYKN